MDIKMSAEIPDERPESDNEDIDAPITLTKIPLSPIEQGVEETKHGSNESSEIPDTDESEDEDETSPSPPDLPKPRKGASTKKATKREGYTKPAEPFTCPKCGKLYKTRRPFEKHMAEGSCGPKECQHCKRVYPHAQSLKIHQMRCRADKPMVKGSARHLPVPVMEAPELEASPLVDEPVEPTLIALKPKKKYKRRPKPKMPSKSDLLTQINTLTQRLNELDQADAQIATSLNKRGLTDVPAWGQRVSTGRFDLLFS